MATGKIALQLRIDEDIHGKMKLIAERERRSLNAQIEYVLEEYIERYTNERGLPEKK